jgi:hypothetical protein
LASIHRLIVLNVILEVLNNLDSQIKVMLGVTEDEFAHVLALIRALFNDKAIVFE